MTTKIRQEVEKRIITAIVRDAIKKGYRLAVSLERGYDTEEMLLGSVDKTRIVTECMAGDEAHLFIQPKDGPTIENGHVVSIGWVYFVLGNDGWDVVSDYTTNLDKIGLMGAAERISEKYQ